MEIERKWLVKDWPKGLEPVRTLRMRQGYIALRPTVRIREEADEAGVEYILCFKGKAGPGGLSRTEIETPVERGLFLRPEGWGSSAQSLGWASRTAPASRSHKGISPGGR